ncbi:DUF7519 family protein [Halobellus sp. GM3]|uniref:DUF7519 family protein n=1 Tax=Halobellus sp. GM3 TaxID=3458410 RepID=UPI00403DFCDA
MTVRRANLRPTVPGAAVAIALAAGVVLALGDGDVVPTALAVQGTGLVGVAAGGTLYRRGRRNWGIAFAVGGGCAAVAAIAVFVAERPPLSFALRVLPGLLGLPLLAAGLLPVRGDGSRTLIKLGAGGVFLSVVLSGLFLAIDDAPMLVAAAATIVAWSAAENAVGVGRQLGRDAVTRRLEAVHIAGSVAVGLAGVVAVLAVRDAAATGLSLASFTLLFVALLLLVAAMRG